MRGRRSGGVDTVVGTFFRSGGDKDVERLVRMSITDILGNQGAGEEQVQSSKRSPRGDGRNDDKVSNGREDHTDGRNDERRHGPDKEEEGEGDDNEEDIEECRPGFAVSNDRPVGLWFLVVLVVGTSAVAVSGGVWTEETINVPGMLCFIIVPSVRGLSLKRPSRLRQGRVGGWCRGTA